jgi:hypothetical protein
MRTIYIFLADQCPRMQASADGSRFNKKSLCVRMRSSLTKRAPNMKTPGYRVRTFFFSLSHSLVYNASNSQYK